MIVNFFLRAKHWQIFLLLFGIGIVGGMAAMTFELAPPNASAASQSGASFSTKKIRCLCA